jgi:SPP1 gp7 family putative phage head morphogenesis protein
MVSQAVIERIRARHTNKNGKLKKLKKPPAWLFPLSPERQYRAALYEFTFEIRKVVSEVLLPKIPAMLLAATLPYPDPVLPSGHGDSVSRFDNFIDFLNETMAYIQILLRPKQEQTIQKAKRYGIEIAVFNQVQYEKTVNSVLGVDVFLEEPWLKNQLELFANQNAQLITNMTDNEMERVSGMVQRGLQEGSSYDSIADNIEKSFGITRRHAKLIARDQTSKLNGSLTKLRQQELGITQYRWQTSGDERVRPSHRVLDDKICRWDDPTVYLNEDTGKWEKRSSIGGTNVHTSQDVNCRCVPIPIIEGLFDGN